MDRIRLRPLLTYDELLACVHLQEKTWGSDFDDIVSAALMRVSRKIGGVAAGAFTQGGDLVAIVFGMTGPLAHQELVHWSHMLAVEPEWQGRGLGKLLKVYQRAVVLRAGIRRMYWTFEPLEARNAHFNLQVLRAGVEAYVPEMYGKGETSPLHRGIGTDRLIVVWDLRHPEVAAQLSPEIARMTWLEEGVEAEVELPLTSTRPLTAPAPEAGGGREHLVEIPSDLQKLKKEDPESAWQWRLRTRGAILDLLGEGCRISGFVPAAAGRNPAYRLVKD